MKIKELKELLNKYNEDMEVVFTTEEYYEGAWEEPKITTGLLDDVIENGLYTGFNFNNSKERKEVCEGLFEEFYFGDEFEEGERPTFKDVLVISD